MKGVLAALVIVIAVPAESMAHRLDEYLQATRVSLTRASVTLEIDLTPGASIAADVIASLDRNGDMTVSPIEAAAYGEVVLRDVVLEVDDGPVTLTLERISTPPIDEMHEG